MAKDPKDRYLTCADLAEDLERWLRGDATVARPSTLWESYRRWQRRNPAIAVITAIVVGCAVTVGSLLFAFAIYQARENVVLEKAKRDADESRTTALPNLFKGYLRQAEMAYVSSDLRSIASPLKKATDIAIELGDSSAIDALAIHNRWIELLSPANQEATNEQPKLLDLPADGLEKFIPEELARSVYPRLEAIVQRTLPTWQPEHSLNGLRFQAKDRTLLLDRIWKLESGQTCVALWQSDPHDLFWKSCTVMRCQLIATQAKGGDLPLSQRANHLQFIDGIRRLGMWLDDSLFVYDLEARKPLLQASVPNIHWLAGSPDGKHIWGASDRLFAHLSDRGQSQSRHELCWPTRSLAALPSETEDRGLILDGDAIYVLDMKQHLRIGPVDVHGPTSTRETSVHSMGVRLTKKGGTERTEILRRDGQLLWAGSWPELAIPISGVWAWGGFFPQNRCLLYQKDPQHYPLGDSAGFQALRRIDRLSNLVILDLEKSKETGRISLVPFLGEESLSIDLKKEKTDEANKARPVSEVALNEMVLLQEGLGLSPDGRSLAMQDLLTPPSFRMHKVASGKAFGTRHRFVPKFDFSERISFERSDKVNLRPSTGINVNRAFRFSNDSKLVLFQSELGTLIMLDVQTGERLGPNFKVPAEHAIHEAGVLVQDAAVWALTSYRGALHAIRWRANNGEVTMTKIVQTGLQTQWTIAPDQTACLVTMDDDHAILWSLSSNAVAAKWPSTIVKTSNEPEPPDSRIPIRFSDTVTPSAFDFMVINLSTTSLKAAKDLSNTSGC